MNIRNAARLPLILGSILFAAIHTSAAFAVPIQFAGNGHWYDAIVAPAGGTISWTDASAAAGAAGGYLATSTSVAENDFIWSVAIANPGVFEPGSSHPFRHGPWLGGFQGPGPEPAGGWAWVTGEVWSTTIWDGGEPNNAGGAEDHLQFHGLGSPKTWNDIPDVNDHVYGYMIEWDTDPTRVPAPASIMLAGAFLLLLRRRRRVG